MDKRGRIVPKGRHRGPAARWRSFVCLFAAVVFWGPLPARADFLYPTTPNWESNASGYVSTGCALRDLNGDGWPDLIVANGNDMQRQPVVVYLNQHGSYPLDPTWISGDIDYQGHLDLADVDGDGALDLAVGVYLGAAGFGATGRVKLYHGNGDGTFSSLPVWSSGDSFYCFSVAFGDVNMDGRPDLAGTAGESYTSHRERFRVYRNVGGALETTPFWQSSATGYALDVTWGDINGDGILDLAYACESHQPNDPTPCPSQVFFGTGSTLHTAPDWQEQDGYYYANTVALGDVNGDGYLDLVLADNNQLQYPDAGYGHTKLFLNDGAGHLHALPDWISDFSGYGSHVSLVDLDLDGDLDLVAGSWWGPVRLYQNQGGTFPLVPDWVSDTASVIENIAWEDIDNSSLNSAGMETFIADGQRQLFHLQRHPVRLQQVQVGSTFLTSTQYMANVEQGWIVLAGAPASGTAVTVRYSFSSGLDFAVSNWDDTLGNYVFFNQRNASGAPFEHAGLSPAPPAVQVVPNPAPGACSFYLSGVTAAAALDLFSAAGRQVRRLDGQARTTGGALSWDGRDAGGRPVPAGSYWVRLRRDDGREASQRLVILR